MYQRSEYKLIKSRLEEPRRFIQVVMGPRQIGKSTVVKQVVQDIAEPYQFFSADNIPASNSNWLSNCWSAARSLMTNIAGYLNVLGDSGLLSGLQKFSIDLARRKASIPKLQVYNNALKTIYEPLTLKDAVMNRKAWGHIAESGIGAFILNEAFKKRIEVFYWRDRNNEVDFVLRKKNSVVAIEIKSNAEKKTEGLDKFKEMFNPKEAFIVGDGGLKTSDFLAMDLRALF
ncbi:MAG: ATP-binding protein [Muribaculaceae bacterium]|nr:ATP-binding protein [Muribaculaceae bacterium]